MIHGGGKRRGSVIVSGSLNSRGGARSRPVRSDFGHSLDAVVDHDGDHAHGDRDDRHADQNGPDPSKANGANHEPDLGRRVTVPSTSLLR
jgi:hypothetical protein